MKHIFVTGANGCIGSYLIRELVAAGYQVTALALNAEESQRIPQHPMIEVVLGDICHRKKMGELLQRRPVDILVHLAALVHRRSAAEGDYMRLNRDATIHLFDTAKEADVKQFVFFSTIAVYGEETRRALTEDDPLAPATPYAESKAQAELYIMNHCPPGMSFTIIRPATVYGRFDRGNINRLFKLVEKRIVPVIGNGRNVKSFVYVGNLVQGVINSLANPKAYNQVFILSDDTPYSINRIVADMVAVLGKKVLVFHLPEFLVLIGLKMINTLGSMLFGKNVFNLSSIKKLTTSNYYNVSKAKIELDYQPVFSLLEGLRQSYLPFQNGGQR